MGNIIKLTQKMILKVYIIYILHNIHVLNQYEVIIFIILIERTHKFMQSDLSKSYKTPLINIFLLLH